MSILAPVLDQLAKLWARTDRMPVVRWATVTQAHPLRLLLDGDVDVLPLTPQSALGGLTVGARVVCVEQHRRVIVIAAPRAGTLVRIGSAGATAADQTGIAATVTEITGTSIDVEVHTPTTVVLNATVTTSSSDVADAISMTIRDGTTQIIEGRDVANSSPTTPGTPRHQQLNGEVTLLPGTHRLNVAVRRATGAGSLTVHKNSFNPSRLTVNRIV